MKMSKFNNQWMELEDKLTEVEYKLHLLALTLTTNKEKSEDMLQETFSKMITDGKKNKKSTESEE